MAEPRWLPWIDAHEDLTLDRLTSLAAVFRKVWRRVCQLNEPDEGDDMWSMSCRAFNRSSYRLKLATQDLLWLSVVEQKKMQLVLCVGVVPVRFYHGEPDDVPRHYASAPDSERTLLQGILNFDDRITDEEDQLMKA